jgi:O-antigen ligase
LLSIACWLIDRFLDGPNSGDDRAIVQIESAKVRAGPSSVKWAFLFLSLAAILPLAGWLRNNPRQTMFWILIGLLPFAIDPFHLYMAIVSWNFWPGYVKGIEVSILDILLIAVYISLPKAKSPLPFKIAFGTYFCAALLSALQASVPEASLFYPWQLARMFLVYAVVTRACANEQIVPSLLKGLAIGLCLEACLTIVQRFVLGEFQTSGSFVHQNDLGLAAHFVVFPFLALLLAGRRGWEPPTVPTAGLVIAVLTVSRATLGLAGLGYVTLFLISSLRKWTRRKGILAAVVAVSLAALAPLAFVSLESRFTDMATTKEYDERAAFEAAARMMLSDHPLGVGANDYVVIANTQGYNEQAGVVFQSGSLSTNVHNTYRLVAAETGFFGLLAFLIFLLHPMVVAFASGWRARGDERGDLLIGLGVALMAVYLHSFYEWVFITSTFQYFFAIEAGMIAGLAQQLGYQSKTRRRRYP